MKWFRVVGTVQLRMVALAVFGLLATHLGVSPVRALPGDLLTTVTVPVPSLSGIGIGVAYDGTDILYTNTGDPTIHRTDLSANNNGSLPIVGAPNCCNAIAYDASTGKLWGGTWDQCDIYEIDLTTGAATLKHDNLLPCPEGFVDGLAWDPVADTLWWSDDVNCTITEINKTTGATIQTVNFFSLIGNPSCSDGLTVNGGNSGLALGLDHTLFMGSNGAGIIYSANADTVPPTFLGSFATVGGRDEDMECGPEFTKPDGSTVETLLSKDAFDNTFAVIEMEPGQCISPAGDTTPPEVACIESVNPHGKKIPPAGSTTLPGAKGGQNEDGFYRLTAVDDTDPDPEIFVNGFGPFTSGTVVKITEAPSVPPPGVSKPIGSSNGQAGAVSAHLIIPTDPVVRAVDAAGNVAAVRCLVPPPPK